MKASQPTTSRQFNRHFNNSYSPALKPVIGVPISRGEFEVAKNSHNKTQTASESREVLLMSVSTGLKFKCRWTHVDTNCCRGTALLRNYGHRHAMDLRARCYKGFVHVWRVR